MHVYATMVPINRCRTYTTQTTKLPYKKLQYPSHVKDINLDAHIRVFKKAIKANGEIVEVDI
jgi:hypothetical protein